MNGRRKAMSPDVDPDRCTGCELCVKACPSFTLAMRGGKAVVARGPWCIGCGHCGAICPAEAVTPQGPLIGAGGEPAVSPAALLRLLRERRSVRLYRDEPVPRDAIERILDAARYAPTGTNSQNVRYVILDAPGPIAELRAMTQAFYERLFRRVRSPIGAWLVRLAAGRRTVAFLRAYLPKIEHAGRLVEQGQDPLLHGAPAVIVAHAEAGDPSSAFNGAAALYAASLAAHALEIGTCFNGFLEAAVNRDREIKGRLGIPRDHRCFGAMTLGRPAVRYLRLVERRPPRVTWRSDGSPS